MHFRGWSRALFFMGLATALLVFSKPSPGATPPPEAGLAPKECVVRIAVPLNVLFLAPEEMMREFSPILNSEAKKVACRTDIRFFRSNSEIIHAFQK